MELDPRTIYAAERTLLAWIRTGLALMGFGFVVARFSLLLRELAPHAPAGLLESPGFSLWIGTVLVLLGVAVNIASGLRFARDISLLRTQRPIPVGRWTLGRIISLILAAIGLMMAVYLLSLGTPASSPLTLKVNTLSTEK